MTSRYVPAWERIARGTTRHTLLGAGRMHLERKGGDAAELLKVHTIERIIIDLSRLL
jgi:hypothetical protein